MAEIREKLLNLYRLAQAGGTEGEAANAERVLHRLLLKHHLTLADLQDEDQQKCQEEFRYKGDHERNLLFAVIRKVGACNPDGGVTYWRRNPNVSTRLSFSLTRAQAVEARMMYDLYLRAFREEVKRLTAAFIHRNRLYNPTAAKTSWDELTPEEQREMERIFGMMENMDVVEVRKQLR